MIEIEHSPDSKKNKATIEISDSAVLDKQPVVSVVMLAYRHEEFIAQAIEGVISQQCTFPIELIIGEDCSPDRTRDIVLDYQRRYPHIIRVLIAEANVGMHANGARCVNACRAEFVALCEGDDYWCDPKKLEMQVSELSKNPSAVLVHTDFHQRIGDKILRDFHHTMMTPHLAQGNAFIDLMHMNTVYTVTAMYRRKAIVEFNEKDLVSNDWPMGDYPLTLYASLMGPVLYLPTATAIYRKVEGSATNQPRAKSIHFAYSMFECKQIFLAIASISAENRRSILVASHKELLETTLLANDRAKYIEELSWLKAQGENISFIPRQFHRLLLSHLIFLKIYRTTLKTKRKLYLYKQLEKLSPK